MNKDDLISEISGVTELSVQDSEEVLSVFAGVVMDELKDGEKILLMSPESSSFKSEENGDKS